MIVKVWQVKAPLHHIPSACVTSRQVGATVMTVTSTVPDCQNQETARETAKAEGAATGREPVTHGS